MFPILAPAPGRSTRVEHEYFREGAWTYLAAWDVHRAKVFGRCEKKSGIAPVDRLIGEVMSRQPHKSAPRVFWIKDNCSAHRGQKILTPNDFKSRNELEQRLLAFERRYEQTASPFQWTFTRKDLTTLLAKIENNRLASAA